MASHTLKDITVSQSATIREISGDEIVVARLREIGFVRGEEVVVTGHAPFGEPILVEVRGAIVALRKEEAECVKV